MAKEKKSVEMAPVLQSFKEYIANHYMDELLQEMTAAMSLNLVEGLDVDCKDSEIIVEPNGTELVRAEPWRVDRTNLIADCKVRLKFGLSKEGSLPRFIIRYINFTAEVTLEDGITLHKGIKDFTTYVLPERKLPKLTKYLVPVLTYEEMEVLVLEMLQKYLGDEDALKDRENGADQLAKAMGLKIQHVSLYRNHYTSAVLYLKEGHARVVASGAYGSGTDDEEAADILIPAKTIVINDNREHMGDVDREIYHECGHYEWHSMFFELQELHAADLRLLEYQEADKASKPAEKDIRWIERQASFVGIVDLLTMKAEIYKDDLGAVCRCWNWRDGQRTMLTDDTVNAFLIIECVDPSREDDLKAAIETLAEKTAAYLGAETKIQIVDKDNKEIEI